MLRRIVPPQLGICLLMTIVAAVAALGGGRPAAAHPHHVTTGNGEEQVIANGQNHPGFTATEDGLLVSCEGVKEPPDSGPAGYGLETAHHGPDQGTPGKGDGCYAAAGTSPPPADGNPAID